MIRVRKIRNFYATFLLAALSVSAQTGVGSLTGQVTDPGGAVVPGAAITAVQDATGRELHTVSSDAGVYSFPTLDIGSYTVSAELKGFKRMSRPNVVILAANRTALDIR